MAKVLETFEFKATGDRSTYPWAEWADGKIRELKQGEDFKCQARTVGMMARAYARKHSLKVQVAVNGETVVLRFAQDKPTATLGISGDGASKGKKGK